MVNSGVSIWEGGGVPVIVIGKIAGFGELRVFRFYEHMWPFVQAFTDARFLGKCRKKILFNHQKNRDKYTIQGTKVVPLELSHPVNCI